MKNYLSILFFAACIPTITAAAEHAAATDLPHPQINWETFHEPSFEELAPVNYRFFNPIFPDKLLTPVTDEDISKYGDDHRSYWIFRITPKTINELLSINFFMPDFWPLLCIDLELSYFLHMPDANFDDGKDAIGIFCNTLFRNRISLLIAWYSYALERLVFSSDIKFAHCELKKYTQIQELYEGLGPALFTPGHDESKADRMAIDNILNRELDL